MDNKKIIGWREWIDLPLLSLSLKAKIDSGARTCALHATDIKISKKAHPHYVSFRSFSADGNKTQLYKLPLLEFRHVRSSDGDVGERPVVAMPIILWGEITDVEVTLIDRSIMGFKMLIGRQAIRRRYLIDPGRSFLSPHPYNPQK